MSTTMDNLDVLSDEELRLRLVQYGFPNLPVTATTRKILIKKLRTYTDSEKSKIRRETTHATRYSSGEESDVEVKRRNKTRTTIAAVPKPVPQPAMPPPVSTKSRRTVAVPPPPRPVEPKPQVPLAQLSYQPQAQAQLQPQPQTSYHPSPTPATPFTLTNSDDDLFYSSKVLPAAPVSPAMGSSLFLSSERQNDYRTPLVSSPTYQSLFPSSEQTTRNRFTPAVMPSTSSPLHSRQDTTNGYASPDDSPYLSEFTKRLLKLRTETFKDTPTIGTGLPPTRRTVNTYSSRYSFDSTLPMPGDNIVHQAHAEHPPKASAVTVFGGGVSKLFSKLDEQYGGVKQTFVPCVLVSALVIFLSAVAFMYLMISPNVLSTMTTRDATYTICPTSTAGNSMSAHGYSCIERNQLDSALRLLQMVAPELQRRAENQHCHNDESSKAMTAKDVINFAIERNPEQHVLSTMQDLHNMEYLVHMNPGWRINNVNPAEQPIGFEDVLQHRNGQSNSFAVLNPRLPLSCFIYDKMHTFFLIVGVIGLMALCAFIVHYVYHSILDARRRKKEQLDLLINDIISLLMSHAAKDPGNREASLVVVSHLRDKLIPPQRRQELEKVWQAAISFIEANESRIQFEVGSRNGEDCRMMRWVDTISPSIGLRSASVKKWQSPAFDKTNKIKDPPTQCLKIRHMFDLFEANNPTLKTIIQDAILEKVGPDCRILDIQLEKSNCWVFVRCETTKDAGIVHDEINGWWFDNRLVSIKFVRLERYLNRYPKSQAGGGGGYLRPSNTKNLSMTQCAEAPITDALDDDDEVDDDEIMMGDDN